MTKVICPGCGQLSATESWPSEYKYRESGLPNIVLRGGVSKTACQGCGKEHFRIQKEAQLLQVIALGLLMKSSQLTGDEMRFLRGACGATQAQVARALKVRRETVSEREAKDNPKLSLADEMWFRLKAIGLFDEMLNTPGRCHLGKKHIETFRNFVSSYCDQVIKWADGIKKQPMRIHLEQGELWELDVLKKAA